MQYLWDTQGKKYLDCFAGTIIIIINRYHLLYAYNKRLGIVTVSVGHCHPKVNEAAKKQMDKLWHTTCIYMTPPIHEYAAKLASKMPGDLKNSYFVNSGSEANDLALLMARLYTGNFDIVSLRNGYHGLTAAVMGITNLSTWKQPAPLSFGIHPVDILCLIKIFQ